MYKFQRLHETQGCDKWGCGSFPSWAFTVRVQRGISKFVFAAFSLFVVDESGSCVPSVVRKWNFIFEALFVQCAHSNTLRNEGALSHELPLWVQGACLGVLLASSLSPPGGYRRRLCSFLGRKPLVLPVVQCRRATRVWPCGRGLVETSKNVLHEAWGSVLALWPLVPLHEIKSFHRRLVGSGSH